LEEKIDKMQGINSVTMSNVQSGQLVLSSMGDPVSRSLQNQIEEVERQIQNLSSDENMSVEEKQKKNQELQVKLTDLQDRLQQHLTEERREQQEARKQAAEQKPYDKTGMQSVISADAAVKNAGIQENTAARMEGRAAVLKSEMELDGSRGGAPIKSRESELARAEQGMENARSSQMQMLGKTNQTLTNGDEKEEEPEEVKEDQEDQKKKRPFMYTSEGRTVTEEEKPHITVRA